MLSPSAESTPRICARLVVWDPYPSAGGRHRTHVTLRCAVESEPDAATVEEALRWPAHKAAFVNDLEGLELATAGWTANDWARHDCCGNTVGHVAAMRSSRECLRFVLDSMRASGANLYTTNSAGWSMLEESIDRSQWWVARQIFDAAEVQTADIPHSTEHQMRYGGGQLDKAALKEQVIAALREMPDFSLRLRWKLGSPIFGVLLGKTLPADTYHIWKCGKRLRIDGTLTGIDADSKSLLPKWKRGHFSIILAPPPTSSSAGAKLEPRLALVNHVKHSYKFLGRIIKHACEELKAPTSVTDTACPCCRVHLSLNVYDQPGAICASGPTAGEGLTTVPGDVAHEMCGSQRRKGIRIACALSVAPAASATHLLDARFDRLIMQGVRDTKDTTRPESATFRSVTDWRGAPKTERLSGILTTVHEATMKLRSVKVTKRNVSGVNSYALHGSFEGYVAARNRDFSNLVQGELLNLPLSCEEAMKSVNMRHRDGPEQEGSLLKVRVWLARKLPLNIEHMQLILNLIGLTNGHAAKMADALGQWDDRDVCVMRLHVPLLLSLYARVSVEAFTPSGGAAMPLSHFEVPASYTESDSEKALTKLFGI